jgi:hypothetical protein
MSKNQPAALTALTLSTLKDSLRLDDVYRNGLVPQLQTTLEGSAYWRQLSDAHVAVAQAQDAGDPVLIGVRHFVARRFGGCDLDALQGVTDWLVAEHRLTLDQANAVILSELLDLLRTDHLPKGVPQKENPDDQPPGEGSVEQPGHETAGNVIRRVGGVWHLRYESESADFPVAGTKFLGWLAELLSKPSRAITVAELYGDPGGKLTADARLGGEDTTDREALQAIRNRLEDIKEQREDTGGSDALDNEEADLLRQVAGYSAKKRIESRVGKAYNNIATQKRQFLQKLKPKMPALAAHLKACLIPSANDYTLSYRPPAGTPRWTIENPTA